MSCKGTILFSFPQHFYVFYYLLRLLRLAHKGLHEFIQAQQTVGTADARHFVVLLNIVGRHVAVPYQEGHRLTHVDALLDGCQVVGQHGDADVLLPVLHLIIYGCYQPLVQILDGLQLQLQVAVVTGLVAGLYMHKDEVVRLQRLDGGLCLAFVVGVGQPRSSGHLDDAQSGIFADDLLQGQMLLA